LHTSAVGSFRFCDETDVWCDDRERPHRSQGGGVGDSFRRHGNPDYPAVEDGLALLADRLLGAGFDEGDVREMIVLQSRRLAGAT